MSFVQARVCSLAGRGATALARHVKPPAPAMFEGQRKLSTDPNIYKNPFPYKTKKFGALQSFVDYTVARLNENSRIITVEGPPYVGKTEFAKKVAQEFNLEYLRAPTMEDLFVYNCFDTRLLNDYYPEPIMRSVDLHMFYTETDRSKVKTFPRTMLSLYGEKLHQYVDALKHVLHTGQGCVLDSSIWSDGVYAELLFKTGHIDKPTFEYYKQFRKNSLCELWKPHLVLYLEAPTSYIMKQVKEKNPAYANGPVLNEKYIETMNSLFKEKFLPYMVDYCEVQSYDVTDMPDFDLLTIDFENMNLIEESHEYPLRFANWRKDKEEDWSMYRQRVSDSKFAIKLMKQPMPWNLSDIMMDGAQMQEYMNVRNQIPNLRYAPEVLLDRDGKLKDTPLVKSLLARSPLREAESLA